VLGWVKQWRARRARASDGPGLSAQSKLVGRARELAAQGDVDGAVALLQGSELATEGMLVLLLRDFGRLDESIEILRSSANPDAPAQLRQFLGERGGQLAGLTRVYGVDGLPAGGLGGIDELLYRGRLDEAIDQLKNSTYPADEERLRNLLRELGRTDELRALAADTIRRATLRAEGRSAEALADLRAAGAGEQQTPPDPAGTGAATEAGAEDPTSGELGPLPEPDRYRLARTAVDEGRADEAIGILQDHPRLAPDLLADLLIDQGRVAEALAALDSSKQRGAPRKAARLRAAHGLVDDLRARAEAGERPSIDLLATYLADHGELDELRRRSVGDDRTSRVFGYELERALGRLRRLGELADLAGADDRPAGLIWWAAVLADAEDVPAALAEHTAYSSWYAGEDRTRGVIDLLVEQARIGTAVAFARARVQAGDEWASVWVPGEDHRRGLSANDDLLAGAVEAAVLEQLPGHPGDQERVTTARIADEGSSFYGDVRVSVPALGQVRISLACWTVGTDTARYFGDDPPTEAETRLPPDGTAVTDLGSTVAVLDELALRLNAIDPASPHPGGRHLTITVPLRTATLTAVPD
jgi:hypothetical protein